MEKVDQLTSQIPVDLCQPPTTVRCQISTDKINFKIDIKLHSLNQATLTL